MQLEQRVKDIICRNVQSEPDFPLEDMTNLLDELALDSLSIANILADMEEEFQISIELEDVSFAMFASVRKLADFVKLKIASR